MARTSKKDALKDMQIQLDNLIQKKAELDKKIKEMEEKIQVTRTEQIIEVVSAINVTPSELKEILEAHFKKKLADTPKEQVSYQQQTRENKENEEIFKEDEKTL